MTAPDFTEQAARDAVESQTFGRIADQIRRHARDEPRRVALVEAAAPAPAGGGKPAGARPARLLSYAELDALMDRVAASLQRDGVGPGEAIALCAGASLDYAVVFLGALRAGVVVAPLSPTVTPASLAGMVADCAARLLFVDAPARAVIDAAVDRSAVDVSADRAPPRIALDASGAGQPFAQWLAGEGARPAPVEVGPEHPFNIIYSSGTTGEPKGIVQPHAMRWAHVRRGLAYGYGPRAVTLLSTPLYSNTTLVVLLPTLAFGGTVVLMPKFDAAGYLALAQAERATHTMLVPVQYQRLMARPDFDTYDLSAFRCKFCTSAPFPAALKADVLARWPGALVEIYGMTEGGGTCLLEAHRHPDKLHTVGRPVAGHDIRLIDDEGREVARAIASVDASVDARAAASQASAVGEVVGRSPGMMTGYFGRPEKTREAEWYAPDGTRFIRTGDVGRFDEDGFLILLDRKKDLVISGGFNIYPSDLEAVLRAHPAVADAAVVGVPSAQWGETPVAFVVARDAVPPIAASALLAWANERLGKTQRLADLRLVDELPRSAIGKVLKRELRAGYGEA